MSWDLNDPVGRLRAAEALEDQADIEAHRRFKEKLASGEEEMIPAEFVNRMLDGENKVKVWREFRGLTLRALAEQSEISAGYLSQIESGHRDGSFDTIKKIAAALRITVDELT